MAYIYDIADTWSGGGTFTGIKLNVTDGGSTAGSLLMDLQVGGVSRFRVDKAGVLNLVGTNGQFVMNDSIGIKLRYLDDTYGLTILTSRSTLKSGGFAISSGSSTGVMVEGGLLTFCSTVGAATFDLRLEREAANTLAQRNGVNAQAFNLYNTYTDASNYERGFMRFVSNVLQIGAEKLGTGTARALAFQTDGTTRLTIAAAGGVFVQGGFRVTDGSLVNLSSGVTGIWSNFGTANYIGNESGHVFSLRTSNIDRLTVDTVGSVRVSTALTVATLPATPLVGMMARVTDATSPAVGSAVTGGGAAAALCWYNGTNWTVIGA